MLTMNVICCTMLSLTSTHTRHYITIIFQSVDSAAVVCVCVYIYMPLLVFYGFSFLHVFVCLFVLVFTVLKPLLKFCDFPCS